MKETIIALAVLLALSGLLIAAVVPIAREAAAAWPGSAESMVRESNPADHALDSAGAQEDGGSWTRYDVPLGDDVQRYICDLCREYDVDMPLVLAVIARESDFDAGLVSDGGHSFGLMQIYSIEHTDRCVRLNAWNLLDPKQNVRTGIDYLAELMNEGKGAEWALMAYNGGPQYANEMAAAGAVSRYAQDVIHMAECIMEHAESVEGGT